MSYTYSIDRTGGTAVDVSVHRLDTTTFREESSTKNVAKGESQTVYTIPTGDEAFPTNIVVTSQRNPKDPTAVRRSSIAIQSWAVVLDGDGNMISKQPISAVLAINTPSNLVEVDDINMLLANLFGLSFDTLTSKIRDTAHVNDLKFGLTKLFGA